MTDNTKIDNALAVLEEAYLTGKSVKIIVEGNTVTIDHSAIPDIVIALITEKQRCEK